jgi:hypothetical protein
MSHGGGATWKDWRKANGFPADLQLNTWVEYAGAWCISRGLFLWIIYLGLVGVAMVVIPHFPSFALGWVIGLAPIWMPIGLGYAALFRWSLAVGAAYRTGQHGHNSLRFFLWPLYQTLDGLVLRVVRQRFGGRLRYLVSGAAALNPKTIQFFWGLGLSTLEAYGTSENAVPIALNRPGAFVFGTTGQPLGPNEVQIGPDREVLVKGPSLFTGYWNQPREDSLFQGTYFRTGDEGRWEHGGFLKLLGRLSEIIKTSTGRRLAPGPIEQHFKEVPFVDQAVVLGNGRKGPALLVTIDPSRLGLTETAEGGFSPALKEKVEKALMDQAARLPSLSQPLGILVLNRAFSVLRGEITSNLKIRRRAIEHHYGSVLDTLYEEAVAASGATVWFLSSSDTRMQEFATLPVLHRLKTSVILRWISLGSFFLRAGRAYAKYSWNLYRAPWNFKKFQFTLFETLIRLFRNTVGPLKGPLVKIGQTLSYVDLGLPPALQGLLRELQYKTQPLSYYYADTYNGVANSYLAQPVDVTDPRFIRLSLQVYQKGGLSTQTKFTVVSSATVRNLKSNLGQ